MDDMNNLGSHELNVKNTMKSSGLWMTWATLGCELKALNAINNYGLRLTWMTLGRELKAHDTMNNLELVLTWMTLGRDSRYYEQLKAMDDLSYSGSWAQVIDAMNNSLL